MKLSFLNKIIFLFAFINFGLSQNCDNDVVDLGPDLSFCLGSTVNLNANVPGVSNSNISNYSWELNGQGVIQNETSSNYNFILNNSTQGTYVVTVNFDNNYNCPSITGTIVVTGVQLSPGTISGNLMICAGSDPPAFTSVTSGTSGSNISYQWQSSTESTNWNDINGETNATYNPGTINSIMYYRRLVIFNGPGNNNCQVASNVVSLQEVSGNLNIQGNNSICVNQGSTNSLTTTFSSTPNNLSPTYSWSGPNGFSSTILSPTLSAFTANQAGTYSVTATIPNVFSSTNSGLCQVTDNVTINLNPVTPTFSIPATGCPGVSFTPTGFTPQAGMAYQWSTSPSIGNSTGLNTATPTFLFNSGGTYTINVTATNNIGGCFSLSATSNINISNFGIDVPTIEIGSTYYNVTPANPTTIAICAGLSINAVNVFNNSTPTNGGTNPPEVVYTFSMNGSTPSAIIDVSPSNINYGNNPLIITANYQGCTQTILTNVYSGSNPFVSFGTSNSTGLCPGVSLLFSIVPIPTNGQSNPPGTTYTVTYSDAPGVSNVFLDLNSVTSVSHTYNGTSCGMTYPGNLYPANTYYAQVTAQNFCGQTSSTVSPITVNNFPTSNFTISDSTICVGQTTTVTNTGFGGNVIGVGSNNSYNCSTQGKFYWTITGGTAGIDYNIASGGVLGSYSATYTNPNGTLNTSSNGSNTLTITYNTPGTYTITQHYYNSCGIKTKVRNICVINPPICQFTTTPQNGCSPLAVNINNSSVAPTCNGSPVPVNYVWTISNPIAGTTATISSNTTQNPTLNFTNTTTTAQTFTVGLNVIPMEPAAPTIPFSTSLLYCPIPISTTGTVGPITGPITGNWSATITGLTSTAGVYVGTIITATAGVGSLGTGGTYTVTGLTTTTITFTSSGGTAPIPGAITNIIRSVTGTVGSVISLGNGNWSTTISGLCSTAGISVGSIIYATNGTGSIGSGGIYTVTAVTASSISYTAAGGTTPITGTLSNIYIQSCTSTCTQVVTVYPEVNFTNPTTATLCSGATLGVNITTNVSSTYTWVATSNPNVSGESTTLQNGAIISDQLVNLTNSVQTVTYTVNATSLPALGSCTKTQTITVTLYPNVTLTDPADLVLCPGIAQSSISFVSNPSTGVTFSWTNNNTSIGLGASANGIIPSFTPVNNTNTTVLATISVTPFWLTCAGTPQTFSITVKPMPTVADPADQTICLGATTNAVIFTSPSNVSGTIYNWTNTNSSIGLAASGTGDINAFTTSGAGTATITITPTANGCSGASQSFTILVKPIPVISPITNQTVCAGSNTTLITFGSSVTGTTYGWVNSNTAIGLGASGNSATIPSFLTTNTSNSAISGTITVTPTFNSCPGLPISFTITVNPRPTVDVIANQVICNGGLTNPVIFLSALNVAGTTFNWTNNTTSTGLASSGTGNISSFTAVNNGNTNLVSTITITPVAGGCNGITGSFTITVKPTPVINSIPNQSICAGANSTLVNAGSTTVGTTYSWTNSNPSIGLIASGNGSIPVFTGQNTSNSSNIATVTVTPTANGCVGSQLNFTITVKPIPTVDAIANQINCNGTATTAVSFSSAFGVSGTTFTWTNSNSSIGLAASGTGNISSFNAINTTANPVISTITITPNANGCSGVPTTYTYTVNPTPSVSAITNQVKCAGSLTNAINFASSPTVSGTQYNWTNSTTSIGLGAASGTGNIASFTTVNTTNIPQISTIVVTPVANACNGPTTTFTITVNPIPTVDAIANQIHCKGSPSTAILFSSTLGVSGTSFNWTNSNTLTGLSVVSGIGNIASFTTLNTTNTPQISTIVVTPIANTCNGSTITFTITVNPTPTVVAIANQVKCAGVASNAINFTSNPLVAGTQYNWTNSNTSIGLTAASGTGNIASFTTVNTTNIPQISTIVVTPVANACNGPTITFTITVNPTPQVLNLNNLTVCPQAIVPANVLTSNVAGATYSWNVSNSNLGLTPISGTTNSIPGFTAINNTTLPVTGTVTITPSVLLNGVTCAGPPAIYTITVNPKPIMNPYNPQLFVFCEATTATVNFNSNISSNMSYSWTNDNTAIGIGASGTSSSPGAGLSFTAVNNSNQPLTSNFIATPFYTNNGVSCPGNPVSFAITINPLPDIIPLNSYTICATSTGSNLYSSLNPIVGLGTTYVWTNSNTAIGMISSGNGSNFFTATNTTLIPISGTITVTPTYTNNNVACTGTPINFTITVTPMPTVNSIANQSLCVGSSTAAVQPTGNIPNTVFTWNNNNTTTGLGLTGLGQIPSFIGLNPTNQPNVSTINVVPSFTFNNITCTGTAGQFGITINPTPILDTIIDYQVCSNSNINVAFTSASNIIGTNYQWANTNANIGLSSTGNGNLSFSATNTSNTPITGQITVTPSYTNAGITCTGNTRTFNITILPTPTVTAISNQTLCSGNASNPINFSSNLVGTVFDWTNSNNSIGLSSIGTGSIASFVATNLGTQPIQGIISVSPSLTTNNQTCTGSAGTGTITVNPFPVMTPISSQSYCQGASVNLVLNSTITNGVIYNWTNSNTAIGLGSAGTGNINFTALNSTNNSITSVISVSPVYTYNGVTCTGNPLVFNIQVVPAPTVNPMPDLVICNNSLTNPIVFGSNAVNTTFTWVNGNTSIGLSSSGAVDIPGFTSTNPSSNTPLSSIVSVTPTLSTGGSTCVGQTLNFTITVNPTTTVNTIPDVTLCNNSNSSGINFSGTGNSYTWNNNNVSIGLGSAGVGNISSFSASNSGTSPITSTISVLSQYTGGGITCNGASNTFLITINPSPTVIAPSNQILCNGSTSNLLSLSGNATSFNWTNSQPNIGLANSGVGNIPVFAAINNTSNPIVATINLTPIYQYGITSCSGAVQSFTITVNPAPAVSFSIGNQTICSNSSSAPVTISSTTTNALISWTATSVPASISGVNTTSGNTNIPVFNIVNSSNNPQTITFLANATTSGNLSCPGGGIPYTITVNPTATIDPIGSQVICAGTLSSAINFTGNATNYTWTNNTSSIGLGAFGNGNIAAFQTINNGSTVVISSVVVTPQYVLNNTTCNGTPTNLTLTINPIPIVSSLSNLTYCNNSTSQLISISGNGTSYNWSNSNTQIGLGATGLGNINPFTTQNLANNPISGTISVLPTFTNSGLSCQGAAQTFSIIVNPTPTINPINNQVICNGSSTNTIQYTGTGTSYIWSNSEPGINLAISGTGNIPVFSATNNGNIPLIGTVTATPVYTNNNVSCNGNAITATITVNPTPSVNVPVNQVICNGTSTSQIVFSGTGTSYNWTNSNSSIGLNSSGTGTINSFTGINNSVSAISGQISVTPFFLGNSVSCTGAPQLFSITINPSPSVVDPTDQVICAGLPTNAINFSGNGSSYNWSNDNTAIGLAASGTGNIGSFNAQNTTTSSITATITVQPIFTGGSLSCPGIMQTFTITVNPTPTLNALSNQVVCNNSSTSTILLNGNSSSFSWVNNTPNIGLSANGTGNIAAFTALNTSNSSPLTGTITVTPQFTNGGLTCNGTIQQLTITVNPTPIVTSVPDITLCNGSLSTVVSFGGTATSYSWINTNSTIGLAPNGIGNIASFTPTNSGIQPLVGSISVTPTYLGNGVNCVGNDAVFNITINPTPTVDAIGNQVICNGSPSISIGFSGNVPNTLYNWTNNTPSIGLTNSGSGTIPSFNGVNNTTNPIIAQLNATPVYTNNNVSCTGTAQNFSITVNPTPLVNFNLSNQTICSQNNNASISISSPTAGALISWNVVSIPASISGFTTTSGGSTIPSFNLVNLSSSPQTIQLIANATTGGNLTCPGGGTPYTITVNPTPIVTDPSDQVICHNSATSTVIFSGTGTSYTWTNNTPSIGLSASGQGNINSFSVNNGTNSIVTGTIAVTPQYTFNTITCPGATENFSLTVNPIPVVNSISNSTFCNGTTSSSIAINGTGTSYSWINSNPSIGLGTSGIGAISPFLTTNAGSTSINGTISITPSYLNAGVSCTGNTSNFTITVNPTPTINPINNQVVCNNTSTSAILLSGTGTSYTWSNDNPTIGLQISGTGNISPFSAINSSTQNDVISTVIATPVYTNNSVSCPGATTSFTLTVNPTPTVIAPNNQTVCNGGTTSQIVFSGTGTSYTWTNSDPSISLASNGTGTINQFVVTNNGASPVNAQIAVTPVFLGSNISCAGNPQNFSISVNPTPTLLDPTDQIVCNNTLTNAVNFSGNGTSYSWVNDNPSIGLLAAGTGNILVFNSINTSLTPIIATISITPNFSGGAASCPGVGQSFTITVNPTPSLTQLTSEVLCDGSSTSPIIFTGTGTSYSWTNNTPAINLAASGIGDIPSFTIDNPSTSNVLVATISATPIYTNAGLNCQGNSQQMTFTVNPTPVITSISNLTYCNATNTQLISFAGTGTTYNWTNNNTTIGLNTSGNGNSISSFNAINQSTQTVSSTINVTPQYVANGITCPGNSTNFTITVNPTPTVNPIANQSLCNGSLTNPVIFTGNVSSTVFNWTNNVSTIGLSNAGSSDITSFFGLNNGTTPVIAQINVTPVFTTNNISCPGNSQSFTYTINPTPSVNNPGNQYSCEGVNTTNLIFGGTGNSYSWSSSNQSTGIPQNGYDNIASFLTQNGSTSPVSSLITVTPYFNASPVSCPGAPQQFSYFVLPNPQVTPIVNQNYCHQSIVPSTTITGTGTSYTWTNSNTSTGLVSGGQNTVNSFSGVNTSAIANVSSIAVIPVYSFQGFSCNGQNSNYSITINPLPFVNNINDTVICNYGSLATTIGSNIPANFTWSAAQNANINGELTTTQTSNFITDSLSNISNSPQFVTYTITPTSFPEGCIGPDSSFIAQVQPDVVLSIPTNLEICSGSPVNAILNANIPSNFQWFVTINNPNVIGESLITNTNNVIGDILINNANTDQVVVYSVFPTSIQGNCIGAAQTITVIVKPPLALLNVDTLTICSNDNVNLNLVANTNVTFNWYADQSLNVLNETTTITTSSVISDVLINPTGNVQEVTYNVIGTSSVNGCSSPVIPITVFVNPLPIVDPVLDLNLCHSFVNPPILLTGNVTGAEYSWTSSSVAIGLPFSIGLNSIPGFITTNLSTSTISAIIDVKPVFTNNNISCYGPIDQFTIVVNPEPSIYPLPAITLCHGTASSLVQVAGPVSGSTYTWTNSNPAVGLGANGIGNIPSFFGTNLTNSTIQSSITVTPAFINNTTTCYGQVVTIGVTIHPMPNVLNDDVTICSGENTNITLQSDIASTFEWAAIPSTEVYNETSYPLQTSSLISDDLVQLGNIQEVVQYQVTPISIPFGCVGPNSTIFVYVNPLPSVNFVAINPPFCDLNPIVFQNESVGILEFIWNFGDGTISYLNNPTHQFPSVGSFNVQLNATNPLTGCTDSLVLPIIVSPSPDANFNYSDSIGCDVLDVLYTASTSNPSWNYLWNFGNGQTTQQVGTVGYQFDQDGCYDVSLTVTNNQGCSSSETYSNIACVFDSPIASFYADQVNITVVEPLVYFYNESQNTTSFEWDFGDGTTGFAENPIHTFPGEAGDYNVILTVYNQIGCIDTASLNINVFQDLIFYVPNSFTPNGDEENQIFLPILAAGHKKDTYRLTIYNRWGEIVFESRDENLGWYGSYGTLGKDCQIGTYTWIIEVEMLQSQEVKNFIGHVNLIR